MNAAKCASIAGTLLAGALSASWAGGNSAARLYVDLDCATPGIDSAASREFAPGSGAAFWVGVRVIGAAYLDSYAFKLAFDPSRLEFVRAAAAVPEEGFSGFLESRGGSAPFFIGNPSLRDSARITVGNSLAGSDSSRSPSGTGLLALIQFRPLAAGMARFDLEDAELLDWGRTADLPAVSGAALALSPSVAIRGRAAALPVARWEGSTLELDLGQRAATLRIADSRGKERFRREGLRGRQRLDLSRIGRRSDWIWLQTAEGPLYLAFPGGNVAR